MFDTTNQTETFDTMAAESDYSAIFDELDVYKRQTI